MPMLGGVKLDVVYSEDRDKSVTVSEHPTEDGFKIGDHVEKNPIKLKISGVCTGSDAAARLAKLEGYADSGARLAYVGRYSLKDALIESISTTKDVDVANVAYKFDIQLKITRIVKAAEKTTKTTTTTKPTTSKGTQQPTAKGPSKRTYIVQRGDILGRIAQKFYGHGSYKYYMIIYNANKAVIGSNPNLIKPGQKLIIP